MLYWTGNWVTFLDSLLQTALLAERADTLRLPTRVRYLRIDPLRHLEHVQEKGTTILIYKRKNLGHRLKHRFFFCSHWHNDSLECGTITSVF